MKRKHKTALRWAIVILFLGSASHASAQKAPNSGTSVSQAEAAIKRDPLNPKLYVALGLAYWDRNDYPRAFEAFQRAVKIGPGSAEAHNWLGVAILEKADLPNAITEFRKAVSLDAKYARAYSNLGSALAKSGEIAEDRKSTRLNSSHLVISYAVFCLKKKKKDYRTSLRRQLSVYG